MTSPKAAACAYPAPMRVWLGVIACSLVTSVAAAEPQSAAPASPSVALPAHESAAPSPRRWYGWQTLIADGLAFATYSFATTTKFDLGRGAEIGLGMTSGVIYSLGTPIVHVAHGNLGWGLLSFALRGVPTSILMLHYPAISDDAGLAYALHAIGTSVLDAFALAREPARSTSAVRVAPTVAATAHGASVAMIGSF